MRSLFLVALVAVGLIATDSHAQQAPSVGAATPNANTQTAPRQPDQDARLRRNRPPRKAYARGENRIQLTAEYNRRARVFGRASADRWLATQRQ
ncbi:hypothetical protein HB779_11400 [Phyllobacterium sp. 628]|uniref:hypothetical protein n=1 Tax=Phyllobacterium sp. 628 TaxID=2718938 RepID=UPI0016623DE9|nr:hypothetical protein [Phyllobacterium sp. 628]QND52440.1 hypothetical protein HB779_11400 [Phyllobacterium sp. 628]